MKNTNHKDVSYYEKLEKEVEQYLVNQVKELGGLCWKFTSPGTAGVPDRLVLYKGKVQFVEMKRHDQRKLSPIQNVRFAQMGEQQIPVHILHSKEGVDIFVKELDGGFLTA